MEATWQCVTGRRFITPVLGFGSRLSPFSLPFLMQNTWPQEAQSSWTHTLTQLSLHWCINEISFCKYMGKPLKLPFHGYITVADTFLSGERISRHIGGTYKGPRGKQEVKCRLTGKHEEVTCWSWVFHPCGFCTLPLQEPQSKAPQPTEKQP